MTVFKSLAICLLFSSFAFGGADLEIKTLKGIPGPEFRLEFVVANHGPDAADQVGCNVYFYANERLVVSQAFHLQPLSAGASRKEELEVDLPKQVITTVKVEIFDSNQADIQPSTNLMQVNIKPPDLRRADLQILDVKADDQKEKGKGGFLVRLRNNGPDRIPASRLNVELQVFGEALGRSDKRIERLDPGAEVETRINIPNAGIIPSTNGALFVSWNSGEVEDSNASNNSYKLPIVLSLRMPDLLPLKPGLDKQGALTFSINNKGNARAPSSITALYINGALVERFNTSEVGPRASQQFRYNAMKLTLEDKIVIVADFNADVEEASEENNRQSLTP